MSGPFGSQQWMYASGGFYSHPIDQSLRFNDDDSAYLSRSFSGIPETWTISFWVKRGYLSGTQILFAGRTSGVNSSYISFTSNQLSINLNDVPKVTTTRLFRDPSAWYHIVVSVTENSTSYCYVNGEEVASWSEGSNAYLFSSAFSVNAIGRLGDYNGFYYDGYMAEVNFIDGTALDATSFGEFKSGVWIPKSYSGSYGTDGFYLDFGNSGSLGADSSGNGNNWTANNLAATDQVIDSPTNNFATLNPVDETTNNAPLSEGNLKYIEASNSYWAAVFGSIGMTSGKYYWEQYVVSLTTSLSAGVVVGNHSSYNGYNYPFGPETYKVYQNGYIYHDGSTTAYSSTYATGDIIGVCVDADAREVWISINGVFQGSPTAGTGGMAATVGDPFPEGDIFPLSDTRAGAGVFNFGQDSSFAGNKTAQGNTDANGIGDFYYAPPSGYLALCTANLPDPAIDPALDDVPADYFNTVLYQGDGSSPRSVTGVGFQPDLVWMKSRSDVLVHGLYDGVRGTAKLLISNSTSAEIANDPYGYISSYDSDGFTLTAGSISNDTFNRSTDAYVSWNWLAGNGTSSNTDGTITSTVSANQKAGFSIVSYTGTGTTGATVGHGLSESPDVIIAKSRSATGSWPFHHTSLGNSSVCLLEQTDAAGNYQGAGYARNPNSTTFEVHFTTTGSNINASGTTYIAYCFHSVEGYSKFGSYTGNGSAYGTFVYTGFRPAFVLIKNASSVEDWIIVNTETDTYNVTNKTLKPNSSQAELVSTVSSMDIVSNGIKLRTSDTKVNGNGNTYIFMAFAEMPFKYSNAR